MKRFSSCFMIMIALLMVSTGFLVEAQAQEMDSVPADETDERLDLIVTESGVIRPAAR